MFDLERPTLYALRNRIADARLLLRRSRWPRGLLVICLGLSTGSLIADAYHDADAARTRWESDVVGFVATHDIEAGTALRQSDIKKTPLPTAGVPTDVMIDDPTGLTLSDSIVAGEIVRQGRLVGPDLSTLAAQLDDGSVALSIQDHGATLQPGDRVDLRGLLDGDRLATRAEVLSVTEDGLIVAVDNDEIEAVIRSLTTGGLIPVLVR